MITSKHLVLAITLGLLSVSAQAIPVIWTLNDVTFDDGGTADGSFVYEAGSNTFSMINISTMGPALGPQSYMDDHPIFGFDVQAVFLSGLAADLTGMTLLAMSFDIPGTGAPMLTDAGGIIPINMDPGSGSFEGMCINPTCVNPTGFPQREITGGSVFGNPMALSEPGTLALLGTGLLFSTFFRRRMVVG